MWDLNRGIVLLTSVTCGCALIYNAWGTILALAFSLLVVVYVCYSLLVNDCLISPHAHCVLDYLREAVIELSTALYTIITYSTRYLCKFWQSTNRFREFLPFWMDRRRVNSYQLSNDSYTPTAPVVGTISTKRKANAKRKTSSPLSLSTSRFGLIDQLSPIPRYPRSNTNVAIMADEKLHHATSYHAGDHYQQQQFKHTSTPMFKQDMRKEDSKNGNIDSMSHSREVSSKKNSPIYTQNHTLSRGENATQFSPEGSPWGTSISPKIRPRPAGVKTVQTIAGPLLASTRYNIDPKVYTDVTSPGLTTRLTKYATEAKNKLNHQSQYGTGQFPKVNLHASPIPMLSTKLTKSKVPVTVRVAPPDTMKYSPPERQKILSNICHTENKSPTSVVKVLREISLKRHASREDIDFEVIKKQKTENFFGEEREMALEEIKQKRTRDDVSKSEEDLSPQSKSTRPAKRTKTRSCYDILNSLSSSIHVVTGVKRKAVDFSRSGTPDFEKHFKSLENAQSNNLSVVSQCQNLDTRNKSEFKEIYSTIPGKHSCNKPEDFPLMKGILKSYDKDSKVNLNKSTSIIHKTVKSTTITNDKESTISTEAVKFTDKLFMKAEPKRNEQLKVFREESNIKANFASNNVEEIRSEDIRNMRQTSMKARLQSMFDAISGKTERRFNPDVVIQAEDVNTGTLPVTCSVTCATLNSSTTTITINTTPLSTAAIVPSGFSSSKIDTKANTKSVAVFKVPNATLSTKLGIQATNKSEIKETNLPAKTVETINQTKTISIASTVMSTESLQKIASSVPSTTSTFTFDKSTSKVPVITPVISSSLPSFGSSTLNSNTFTTVTTTLTSSTSTNFLATVPAKNQEDKTPVSLAFVPINSSANSSTSDVKVETSNIFTSAISLPNMASTRVSSIFTFGSNKSVPVCTSAQILVSNLLTQTTEIPVQTTVTNSGFNANSISSTSISNSITPITTTSLFGFKSNATILQAPKSDIFTFGQSNNTNIQPMSTQAMSLLQNVATTKSFNYTSSISTSINAGTSFSANAITTTPMTTTIATTTTIPITAAISTTTTIPIITAIPTTTVIPAFGLPVTSTFPLGTSVTSTTSSSSKSLFLFGASNPSVVSTSVTTTATNLSTMSSKTIPAFGMPTTIVSQFSTPTTSIFTAISNTISSTSIFSTSQPVFGAVSRSANIFNTSKTTESPIFASTITSASLNSTAGSNLFSNASTSSTTPTSSVFSTGTLIFGQTKPSTSFGTNTGAMFGTNTPSLFSSTTQTTSSSTFGNISTSTINPSNFDITNNAAPAFGTNIGTATNVQTAPTFGSTTSMFSSTDSTSSVPIFGTNATSSAAGTFGASSGANVFGTQNSTSLAFESTNNSTTFSDGKSLFGATPTTTAGFGTPSSSIAIFGTSNANNNNTNNNTNNMFVFGNNQKDGQQNTTFSFGSSFNAGNNNAASSSSTPFQFGSTSTKPAIAGFNFTAAAPTINFATSGTTSTFNPSTPGMFSIGSGSTAPRSRTIRTRKPR